MFCCNCGQEIISGANFCHKCGIKVGELEAAKRNNPSNLDEKSPVTTADRSRTTATKPLVQSTLTFEGFRKRKGMARASHFNSKKKKDVIVKTTIGVMGLPNGELKGQYKCNCRGYNYSWSGEA